MKVLEESDDNRSATITKRVYDRQVDGNVAVSPPSKTTEEGVPTSDIVDLPSGGKVEYADAECACRHCLPIHGDSIIGTKGHAADAPTIVHRLQRPYAQQALNDAKSGATGDEVVGDPVKLVWSESESWEEGEVDQAESFLTEIVVMANDRKLLLADCSVVASKNSEILKTGSSSSAEHCTLE